MFSTICLYVVLSSVLGLALIGIFYMDPEPAGGAV